MPLSLRKSRAPAVPSVCPLTACMSLLRGAWTPNVIWYLCGGPRRFGELRTDIPRISARVLSARLRELEQKGLITRSVVATSPPSADYALTELGQELLPVIHAIIAVGRKLEGEAARLPDAPGACAQGDGDPADAGFLP